MWMEWFGVQGKSEANTMETIEVRSGHINELMASRCGFVRYEPIRDLAYVTSSPNSYTTADCSFYGRTGDQLGDKGSVLG
jgi:hypothetical protein